MQTIHQFGRIDILVNNAGVVYVRNSLLDVDSKQRATTFNTNVFSQFILTKAALPLIKSGNFIINATSISTYLGQPYAIDYSASKGDIVSFTRSLSPAYVFLATDDASYITGQILHVNGGEIGTVRNKSRSRTIMKYSGIRKEQIPSSSCFRMDRYTKIPRRIGLRRNLLGIFIFVLC